MTETVTTPILGVAKAFCETRLPWEVSVKTTADGYFFVGLTFCFCFFLQFVVRHFAILIIGQNNPKRGLAARVGVKVVSVLFDIIAVVGGLKELVAPEEGVVNDPIYGFSSHSQFHFAVAAGYFAWAAAVTLMYRGSKVSLAHHVACCLVYLLTLRPFLHHIGNLFLLFQASTLLIDLSSCAKVMGLSNHHITNLRMAHTVTFFVVRLGVGLPMSHGWVLEMLSQLESGTAHSFVTVVFMIAVNALINVLNVYWSIGMLAGLGAKSPCSTTTNSQPKQFFDVGKSISFGVRDEPHKRPAVKRSKGALAKALAHFDQFILVNVFLFSAVIGVLGIMAGVDQFLVEQLGFSVPSTGTQIIFSVAILSTVYGLFNLAEKFGAKVFDEATPPASRSYLKSGVPADAPPMYTRIRGEWYDLAHFDHPGGPVALALCLGRDGTALFESHHYLIDHGRLMSILNKFKVPAEIAKDLKTMDPRDDGAHYDWDAFDKDPLTIDIKAMVLEHFRPEAERRGISIRQATKATPQRWFMIITMMATFFLSLPAFVSGSWWALFATPTLAWLVIANYWHDGLHFSLSTDWRVNATLPYLFPWLSSPWLWYHQHVIGHHCYTNVAHKDPDLAHAPQLMREHNSIKWRPAHATQESWQRVLLIWSVAVGAGMQILSDVRANFKGTYNNVVPYKSMETARFYAHSAGRLFYFCSLFVWPWFVMPVWKAPVFAFFPITLFSWWFMLNSQINHLTADCAHAEDTRFFRHQIITAQDFGTQSAWCFFFSGGLNMQIEHHMFPCINHCHLPALQKKVMALCEKHNVKYDHVSGYKEAFVKHVEHTSAMGIRPFSEGHEH